MADEGRPGGVPCFGSAAATAKVRARPQPLPPRVSPLASVVRHAHATHAALPSLQVANIVADEFRGLAEVFSPEHMALFLARMRASSVQLVHLEGRLNLPSKAATKWDPLD